MNECMCSLVRDGAHRAYVFCCIHASGLAFEIGAHMKVIPLTAHTGFPSVLRPHSIGAQLSFTLFLNSLIVALTQRVQSTYIVECRVSILGIVIMIWGSIPHNST